MEKMIFGRFMPGKSFVHQLDPRAKLLFVFAFIIIVFLANNTVTYALLLAFTLVVILVSRIRLYFLINGLKPVIFLMVFTFLLHILFTKEGVIVLDLGFLKIYENGLRQGIFISIRFLVLVFMTSILTLTTSPISESLRRSMRLASHAMYTFGFSREYYRWGVTTEELVEGMEEFALENLEGDINDMIYSNNCFLDYDLTEDMAKVTAKVFR